MSDAPLGAVLRHLRGLAALHRFRDRPDGDLLHAFVAEHDHDAFTAVVRRHGPMVLGVCRRVLGHLHDAEDAFQATFLLLARKAGSIRKQASLASWLHGVAQRMANNAHRSATRRRRHEAKAPAAQPTSPERGAAWREVQALLDEEIQRLPQRYRTPFILCILEGHSDAEVARQLGVKEGTVRSWLSRAREMLRNRLAKRGVELPLVLAAVGVSSAPAAVVPGSLVAATVEAAALYATQGVTATASVAALVKGVNQAMLLAKLKATTFLVLAVAFAGAGLGGVAYQTVGAPDTGKPTKPSPIVQRKSQVTPAVKKSEDPDLIEIRGRVVDPEGKPVAGAAVHVVPYSWDGRENVLPLAHLRSGSDGHFQASYRKSQVNPPVMNATPWNAVQTVAVAPGYGPAWTFGAGEQPGQETTLRLARDDMPLRGRVLDLQGKPVPGVQVRVTLLWAPSGEDLTAWLDTFKREESDQQRYRYLRRFLEGSATGLQPVTTGADGRFVIHGLGRERLVEMVLEGPAIAKTKVTAMTRTAEFPRAGSNTYHGAVFDVVARPTQPIEGVVRDADSGEPLAGVSVESYQSAGSGMVEQGFVRTKTDAQGRYRLLGMPKGNGNMIMFVPTADQPYFMQVAGVSDEPGLAPITVDRKLKRGIWIRGRVTDQVTGKPVFAEVKYFAFLSNEFASKYPNFTPNSSMLDIQMHYRTRPDGSYQLVGLPGRGLVCSKAFRGNYVLGRGAESIAGMDAHGYFGTYMNVLPAGRLWWHVLAEINPPANTKGVEKHLTLDPGRTLEVRFVGPDGQPLTGVEPRHESPVRSDRFLLFALDPAHPRLELFSHKEKNLAKAVWVRGDEAGGLTVKLEPYATVTGRVVNQEGRPVSGAQMEASIKPINIGDFPLRFPPVATEQTGRFRYAALVAGARYAIHGQATGYRVFSLDKEVDIEPAKVVDVGEMIAKPDKE
jgi:RNA polymerase sigma factor (sigma-70 family)